MYNKKEFKEIASLINSLDKITVYILSAKKDTEITVRKDLLMNLLLYSKSLILSLMKISLEKLVNSLRSQAIFIVILTN